MISQFAHEIINYDSEGITIKKEPRQLFHFHERCSKSGVLSELTAVCVLFIVGVSKELVLWLLIAGTVKLTFSFFPRLNFPSDTRIYYCTQQFPT